MFALEGEAVVVTGGGRGIGRVISRACAAAGANVVITGRTPGPLDETAAELAGLGAQHLIVPGDIMAPSGIDAHVPKAQARFGSIDGWVNHAGSAPTDDVGPMLDTDQGHWYRVFDLTPQIRSSYCRERMCA